MSDGEYQPIKRKFHVHAKDDKDKEYKFSRESYSPRSIHKSLGLIDHKVIKIMHGDKDVTNESEQMTTKELILEIIQHTLDEKYIKATDGINKIMANKCIEHLQETKKAIAKSLFTEHWSDEEIERKLGTKLINDARNARKTKEHEKADKKDNDHDKDDKKIKEDIDLVEHLTAEMPAAKWIEDFVKSKDPKFDGKSEAERKEMALGAYYGAKRKAEKK